MTDVDRLVGRGEVVDRLYAMLLAARDHGCVVGLTGEAGVGKSALQAVVVEKARAQRFTVLSARGSESETHLPFASLHQVLRPLLDQAVGLPARQRDALLSGFGMTEAAAADPFLMSLAALELVAEESRRAPVLVSLDDLHWMDEPSVDVLAFMARRVAGEHLMILMSARTGTAPLLDDASVESISVTELSPAAAAELLAVRAPDLAPALRDRVLREAGGNPLALREFPVAMRSGRFGWTELSDELPMTTRLEQTFVSRVERLPSGTRTLLAVAALDDGSDPAELLAAAAVVTGGDVDADAARPALEAGLLLPDGQLAHPLVRSALQHSLRPERRRGIHAALATVLAGAHSDRAAWHRAAATTTADEQVAAELAVAARSAVRRGALGSAVRWLQRAAALSPDAATRGSRLLGAAEIAFELGRADQVERIRRQIARTDLLPTDRSRLAWLEGAFDDGASAEPAQLLRFVDLAEQAHRAGDPDLALQLLIGAARRVWWGDPADEVRHTIVQAAVAAAPGPDDPRLLAVLALADAVEHGATVLRRLAATPPGGPPETAVLLGIAAFCAGDHALALGHLSTPLEDLRGQGRMSVLAEALTVRAWAALYLGAFDEARCADEAARLADETGRALWAAIARVGLDTLDAVRGTHDADPSSPAAAERAALGAPVALSTLLAVLQLARGLADLADGRHDTAYEHLRPVFDAGEPAHHRVQQIWALGYLVDAAVPLGLREEMRVLLTEIEHLSEPAPAPAAVIALEYSRAVLADEVAADALYLAALDGACRTFPWHRARAELAHGSWLRRQRRIAEARVRLRAARATFDALGATAWAARAAQELRASGDRVPQRDDRAGNLLSPQEAEIAHLAAQGLSNREIGQRLYLSHRTVGSHLYRIFPKLGVTSRAQLGTALTALNAVG